jgi:hypothetical protein
VGIKIKAGSVCLNRFLVLYFFVANLVVLVEVGTFWWVLKIIRNTLFLVNFFVGGKFFSGVLSVKRSAYKK